LNDPEFVEADPGLVRLALTAVVAVAAVGSLTLGWLLPWMLAALEEARAGGALSVPLACWLFLGLVVLLSAPVVAFGVHAVRFGRSVVAAGRYPPPGTRVLRRTRVLTGPAAALTGRGQVVTGVMLVFCGIALVVVAAWGVWLLAFAPRPQAATSTAAPPAFPPSVVAGPGVSEGVPQPVGAPLEQPIDRRAVVFMEGTAEQIQATRVGRSDDDFAVIADDLMFYRAVAHERLAEAGAPVHRLAGRRPLAFVVDGVARTYDFAEVETLDLIVVYVPGAEPRAFATLEVDQALEALAGRGR
jgi:hypothetical protein